MAGSSPRKHWLGSADPQFASSRVGKKFDLIHALSNVVKYGLRPFEQRAPVEGGFDALRGAVEQANAERVLHFGHGFRHCRLRDRKLPCGFCHTAVLRDDD